MSASEEGNGTGYMDVVLWAENDEQYDDCVEYYGEGDE